MTNLEALRADIGVEELVRYAGGDPPREGSWDRWVSMRCPFHADSDPSASIHRGKGLFNCHVCFDQALDIFDLAEELTQMHHLPDQIEWLKRNFA